MMANDQARNHLPQFRVYLAARQDTTVAGPGHDNLPSVITDGMSK
jgi:hypothetical protein